MTEPLHIKTYFASSVPAALLLARRELGPDAMLLNTRQSPAEARHLGQYEAVFATVPVTEGAPAQNTNERPSLNLAGLDANWRAASKTPTRSRWPIICSR